MAKDNSLLYIVGFGALAFLLLKSKGGSSSPNTSVVKTGTTGAGSKSTKDVLGNDLALITPIIEKLFKGKAKSGSGGSGGGGSSGGGGNSGGGRNWGGGSSSSGSDSGNKSEYDPSLNEGVDWQDGSSEYDASLNEGVDWQDGSSEYDASLNEGVDWQDDNSSEYDASLNEGVDWQDDSSDSEMYSDDYSDNSGFDDISFAGVRVIKDYY